MPGGSGRGGRRCEQRRGLGCACLSLSGLFIFVCAYMRVNSILSACQSSGSSCTPALSHARLPTSAARDTPPSLPLPPLPLEPPDGPRTYEGASLDVGALKRLCEAAKAHGAAPVLQLDGLLPVRCLTSLHPPRQTRRSIHGVYRRHLNMR